MRILYKQEIAIKMADYSPALNYWEYLGQAGAFKNPGGVRAMVLILGAYHIIKKIV